MEDTRLGSILLESGLVSEEELERCLSIQALPGCTQPIGQILIDQGLVGKQVLGWMLELQDERRADVARNALTARPADAMSDSLLRAACSNGAVEMVVSEGRSVRIRVADRWRDLTGEAVSGPEVWDFAREVVGPQVLEQAAEHNCVTRTWRHPEFGFGSAKVFRHFDGVAVRLTFAPRDLDCARIGIPASVVQAAKERRGLVLVAGGRGGYRTEALAALALASAADPASQVIVIDDEPMALPATPALLVRRTLGSSPELRAASVRSAVREDPDVLVIGNVSEAATFEVALRAAEDGRLVIAHIDAESVALALARILDFYPAYDAARVRASLAGVLRALLVRHQFAHSGGKGVVTATELLLPDEAVRESLREGQLADVALLLRMGGKCGHSLDRSLLELVTAGDIDFLDAFTRAEEKAWLLERTGGRHVQEQAAQGD